MATTVQQGYRSQSALDEGSVRGLQKTNSETKIKEKKSLGKKISDWFKKPFTKASTNTDIPLDQQTNISSSQNLEKPAKLEWNPYQHPAHGQIFVPGSIAVIRQGEQAVAYVPGNIAVAVNRPGINMDAVPMLLAQNTVQETEPVLEETPKLEGHLSPKFETLSPKYNPVDVAAQINEVEHMNELDAEAYKNMRESRMLYASNTQQQTMMMNDPKYYVAQAKKKSTIIKDGHDSLRESRQYA